MDSQRVVIWFSCGAASAIAAMWGSKIVGSVIVYCDTLAEEHPDNLRFLRDVEKYMGKPITIIKSKKFNNISEVFNSAKFMSGPTWAPCTVEMKKVPRFNFQKANDIHVFGFTFDEKHRLDRLRQSNPELEVLDLLGKLRITKNDCLKTLKHIGIRLPTMYKLGYSHNNCLGCVKATSPKYWNKIRNDFPEVWELRNKQSRELNCRLAVVNGVHVFLDEVPINCKDSLDEDLSCGPECRS